MALQRRSAPAAIENDLGFCMVAFLLAEGNVMSVASHLYEVARVIARLLQAGKRGDLGSAVRRGRSFPRPFAAPSCPSCRVLADGMKDPCELARACSRG